MMRTDLHILFPYGDNQWQEEVIELKILHESYDYTLRKGLIQTAANVDKCGTKDRHLVIFNRDPEIDWEEKSPTSSISTKERIFMSGGCRSSRNLNIE